MEPSSRFEFQAHHRCVLDFLPWSTLIEIGNSKSVKLTILIPLLGYLVGINDVISIYITNFFERGGMVNGVNLDVTFDRLRQIYFGLCSIATGSTIFLIFCPKEVKFYRDEISYVSALRINMNPFLVKDISVKLAKHKKFLTHTRELQIWFDKAKLGNREYANEMFDRFILHLHYRYLDQKFIISRFASGLFFFLGFALLAIRVVEVFIMILLNTM